MKLKYYYKYKPKIRVGSLAVAAAFDFMAPGWGGGGPHARSCAGNHVGAFTGS